MLALRRRSLRPQPLLEHGGKEREQLFEKYLSLMPLAGGILGNFVSVNALLRRFY